MLSRPFGSTGLAVSALGFGAGHVGGGDLSEDQAGHLLNLALDLGITLVDTARGYGASEERIGRHLAHRRGDYVLSTKGGYGVDGVPDWTGAAVARGIDEALGRLRTDRIDVFHLHSCSSDLLAREDIQRAVGDAHAAGKIRVAAYSGENEGLDAAADMPLLGSVQCSVNLADQRSTAPDGPIARARARGRDLGVIGKRPIANAAWRFDARPHGDYAEVYWERLQSLRSELAEPDWPNVALRFSAFAPGVSSVIVGTKSLENLRTNAAIVAEGALPESLVARLRAWFAAHGRGWRGEI